MAAKKSTKILIKAKKKKKNDFLNQRLRAEIRFGNCVREIRWTRYYTRWANGFEKSHSLVCYVLLFYVMVWYEVYGMLLDFYATLCMLCYSMVYVEKGKHSATVMAMSFFIMYGEKCLRYYWTQKSRTDLSD